LYPSVAFRFVSYVDAKEKLEVATLHCDVGVSFVGNETSLVRPLHINHISGHSSTEREEWSVVTSSKPSQQRRERRNAYVLNRTPVVNSMAGFPMEMFVNVRSETEIVTPSTVVVMGAKGPNSLGAKAGRTTNNNIHQQEETH